MQFGCFYKFSNSLYDDKLCLDHSIENRMEAIVSG